MFGRFWTLWTLLDGYFGRKQNLFGRIFAFGRSFGRFGRYESDRIDSVIFVNWLIFN
jgi:hypothetical protein